MALDNDTPRWYNQMTAPCADDVHKLLLLPPRVWRIIRWLLEHVSEVEGPDKLTLTFDCAGSSVQIRHTVHDKAD